MHQRPAEDATVECTTAFWERGALSPVQFSKLLLAITSTVDLGFGPRRDPWPYFCSFHVFICFELGPRLRREEGSDRYWSHPYHWGVTRLAGKLLLVLASTVIFGSGSDGTHDFILLSDGSESLQNIALQLREHKAISHMLYIIWVYTSQETRHRSQSRSWMHCCRSSET
jgi:hypothetical protein